MKTVIMFVVYDGITATLAKYVPYINIYLVVEPLISSS